MLEGLCGIGFDVCLVGSATRFCSSPQLITGPGVKTKPYAFSVLGQAFLQFDAFITKDIKWRKFVYFVQIFIFTSFKNGIQLLLVVINWTLSENIKVLSIHTKSFQILTKAPALRSKKETLQNVVFSSFFPKKVEKYIFSVEYDSSLFLEMKPLLSVLTSLFLNTFCVVLCVYAWAF